jgi:hypothetical protein
MNFPTASATILPQDSSLLSMSGAILLAGQDGQSLYVISPSPQGVQAGGQEIVATKFALPFLQSPILDIDYISPAWASPYLYLANNEAGRLFAVQPTDIVRTYSYVLITTYYGVS